MNDFKTNRSTIFALFFQSFSQLINFSRIVSVNKNLEGIAIFLYPVIIQNWHCWHILHFFKTLIDYFQKI